MNSSLEPDDYAYRRLSRSASVRRNLRTGAIVLAAFSGGFWGVTWLAVSSCAVVIPLMTYRILQNRQD